MFVHPRPRRKLFDSMIYFNRSFATSERDWRGQSGDNVEMRPQHAHELGVTEVKDAHGAPDLDRSVEAAR